MWEASEKARKIKSALRKVVSIYEKHHKESLYYYYNIWINYNIDKMHTARREALLYHIIHTAELRQKLRAYIKWKRQIAIIPKIKVALYIIIRYMDRKRLQLLYYSFNIMSNNNFMYWRKRLVVLAWKNALGNKNIEKQQQKYSVYERSIKINNGLLLLSSIFNSKERFNVISAFNKWKIFNYYIRYRFAKLKLLKSKKTIKQKLIYTFIDKRNSRILSNYFIEWKLQTFQRVALSSNIELSHNIGIKMLNNMFINHNKHILSSAFNHIKFINQRCRKIEENVYFGSNFLENALNHILKKRL